jgi:hypothetical protein
VASDPNQHPSFVEGTVGLADGKTHVSSKSTMKVSGTFRIRDGSDVPSIVIVSVVIRNPDGRESTANSDHANTELGPDGIVTYAGELGAPQSPGSYKLRAESKGFAFAESHVLVED